MVDTFDNLPDDDASLDLPAHFKVKLQEVHPSQPPVAQQWARVDARLRHEAASHFAQSSQPVVAGRIGRKIRLAAGLAAVVAISAALWFSSDDHQRHPDQQSNKDVTSKQQSSDPLPALAGDINRDGQLNILDAYLLQRKIENAASLEAAWDLTRDGQVDASDVSAIAAQSVKLEGGPRL